MDVAVVLDSKFCVAENDKIKGAKGPKIGSASRKRLADISNLQQQPKLVNQVVNQLPISLTTKEYIEKLQKENTTLMKLVVERNKIIELSRIELQKLRISLQKVRQQNLQLAQANSQMLAEVNSGKDRLKALQHELGCKNGLLKAQKLDSEILVKKVTLQNSGGNEVGKTGHDEAGESAQRAIGDSKTCHNNRRKRQSKNQSLGPTTRNQINIEETVENKSHCLRRQSARFKSEEAEPSEDLFVTEALSPTTLKPVLAKQDIGNKSRHCLRRQSARFNKSEEAGPSEDLFVTEASGPTTHKPVLVKQDIGNKRHSLRRQSARFKFEEAEPSEDLFVADKASGPTTIKPVLDKQDIGNKRHCLRRQSARFKSEEPEQNEDLFEIDVAEVPASSPVDDVHDSSQILSGLPVKKEDGGNTAIRVEAQEIRRSSVGRPLRRAVEKVQSYKEIPLKMKMRREE